MKAKTHFAFRIDVWDTTGDNVVEQLAGLDDYTIAIAAYWAAVEARPRDKITLRQGAGGGEKLDVRFLGSQQGKAAN
jgi:hypothetical protein